jgi:GH15 family glucan-1,4-alpha-glucosidase
MAYLPIADYGVIGDLHTAVLVGRNGSIDWCCAPRFDSPAIFGALLDNQRGGRCRVGPVASWTSEQRYLPATNVLETAFQADGGGLLQLTDFMPVGPARGKFPEIHRLLHCVRGDMEVEVCFEPRFDYALRMPFLVRRVHGVLAADLDDDVVTIAGPSGIEWKVGEHSASARFRMSAGDRIPLVLRFDDDDVHPVDRYQSADKLEMTTHWWDQWAAQLQYQGPYRNEVLRSALALKLCCYDPSGAIVAAPTTSLPESRAGIRNWDYRYTWLRDSAFVLYSLDHCGYAAETDSFFGFLKRVTRKVEARHLQIMFAVDGRREIPERVLDHLEGYAGARPVRIGNGAVDQFQLDIYGELLVTADIWRRKNDVSEGLWKTLRDLVDWTAAHWRDPDLSIWEPRHAPRHHVFSKMMAWAALDRGARIARELQLPGEAERWRAEANILCEDVLANGFDPVRGTFVQAYGEPWLDAALLVAPKIGFLSARDPRVRSTLEAVRRELGSSCEDLIYRYRSPDGLDGGEGAFLFCSFWMVQNLAMIGEVAEAERLFRMLLRRANHVGLLAEEIDPATGEQLGNFPQALSHAELINTAVILERLRPRPETAAEPSTAAQPAYTS